jgi:hypothetical protein
MTGNLVFLGLGLGQWNTPLVTRAALALVVYGLGVLCSQPVLTRRSQGGKLWPVQVTIVLSAQLVLLIAAFAAFVALGRPTGVAQYGLLTLYAFSMGMQSAAFRVLQVPGILGTTYLTGNVVVWFSALVGGRVGLSSAAIFLSDRRGCRRSLAGPGCSAGGWRTSRSADPRCPDGPGESGLPLGHRNQHYGLTLGTLVP